MASQATKYSDSLLCVHTHAFTELYAHVYIIYMYIYVQCVDSSEVETRQT